MALFAWLGATSAWGQALPDQTLDQVDAFDANVVLDMAFADPNAPDLGVPDFTNLGVKGGGVAACKIAPRGLYCLATVTTGTGAPYQVVRFWEDPKAKPTVPQDLLRCDDTGLGLQPGVAAPCIGLTVDLSGAIWVTGSKDGKNYSLIKVDKPPAVANCGSAPWAALTWPLSTTLCAAEFATGAGVLSDLNAIDGEEVAGALVWPFGYGILGLWNGVVGGLPVSDAVFFDRSAPTVGSPRSFGPWGLAVGQRLLSTSLLQIPQTAPTPPLNYILATTNTGRVVARAATDPAPASGNSSVFDISVWEAANPGPTSINLGQGDWSACQSTQVSGSCTIRGTTLTATGGTFATKTASTGAIGLGVNAASGGTAGEIDVNESVGVVFPSAHKVSAIQILFLFNGPEYGDPAEKVRITVDGGTDYYLATRPGTVNDDDTADWSGPGSVSKCGTTLNGGTGCFLITNPFPTMVTSLSFTAVDVNPVVGGNDSDFAIGRIETAQYGVRTSSTTGRTYLSNRDYSKVLGLRTTTSAAPFQLELATSTKAPNLPLALSTGASFPDGLTVAPGVSVDLTKECPTPIDANGGGGCTLVSDANGTPAAKLGAVQLAGNSTASGVKVFQVTDLPDCRYQPRLQDCYKLLTGGGPVSDVTARAALISAGWIVRVAPAPAGDDPAAQRLNVTPLLPEDVTSQFDNSGVAPGGLPPLYISQRYRAQDENQYKFDALFFKTEAGVYFTGTFGGEIDVLKLSGFELGCDPPAPGSTIAERLRWDAITTVSETYVGVGGVYIDTLTNVGCRNPTKINVGRTSLFPYNLEISPDTYGPTVRKTTAGVPIVDVTPNNDGVFGRLVQSLYTELRTALDEYTCVPPKSTLTNKPLINPTCDLLRKYWDSGKQKLDACVDAAFQPKASASNQNCQSFRNQFDSYKAALPATTSGRPDLANRLGEQKWRWEVTKHVFETRFLPSIPPNGYCRERFPAGTTACPNTPL